jgi:hypothetical protein
MTKIIFISIILIMLFFLPNYQATTNEIQESMSSTNRPFFIRTNGETQQKSMLPFGCIFILHMLKPWPDQTYYTFLGIVFYADGETTIHNTDTNETISAEGSHTVFFYKFYGPISSVEKNNISFEGNAVYATIIGG